MELAGADRCGVALAYFFCFFGFVSIFIIVGSAISLPFLVVSAVSIFVLQKGAFSLIG